MTGLVQIGPGTHVDPATVTRVYWLSGAPAVVGFFGRVRAPATPPSVLVIFTDGRDLRWAMDTDDDAEDFADEIARALNGEAEPDGDEPEEKPEDRSMVTLRAVGA